jgi:spore maturation protein CgeB
MTMNIIYISKSMSTYVGSQYQQDIIEELMRAANVYFYGPGFPDYDRNDDISEIIAKSNFHPDCILLGHAWLPDNEWAHSDPHPGLGLRKTSIPKFGIINKEYVNLERKLEYYKHNEFDIVFSHHHEVDKYSERTGIKFVFWPFGVNHHNFNVQDSNGERGYDFSFTGILQNQNSGAKQSNIRVRLQSELFNSIKDIPVIKKRKYKDFRIYWSGIPRNRFCARIAHSLGKYRFLSIDDYQRLQENTKIFVNTLSPIGLVGTRYYECMASKCLVLCEKSDIYAEILDSDCFVQFKHDLSDFHEKILYYTQHADKRENLVEQAYAEVMAKHTCERRIAYMLDLISAFIKGRESEIIY